ncbi:hypothetical protein [Lentzea atacamensis]|uniref:hypothetical protein n=1 Tax=Lentzea atacamensis TaxID=531938 RepID=UPI001C020888|nr:hypothetical protein [Lentzea atacamensis]
MPETGLVAPEELDRFWREAISALPRTGAWFPRGTGAGAGQGHGQGVRTARRRRAEELTGREVWLLNALHGIRLVTGWTGCDATPGSDGHFARWRERVERLRLPRRIRWRRPGTPRRVPGRRARG